MLSRIRAALAGAKHLWQHQPVRILYITGVLANAAYDQLTSGIAPDTVIISIAVMAMGELAKATVTSPATADPDHSH